MTFPQRNIFGFPKGWRDAGEVAELKSIENGKIVTTKKICNRCSHILHVGLDEAGPFLFCQKCDVKAVT